MLALLARNGPAKQHPAKVSSNLFYLATIIIHGRSTNGHHIILIPVLTFMTDLFVTDESDNTKSRSSSYLDLGPLYGHNQQMQDRIRTFENGLLKKDAFAEQRLLGQPPGVCALAIAFSRFHNYVVGEIATINEGGRFNIPTQEDPAHDQVMEKRDEELFQTGRLYFQPFYFLLDCVSVGQPMY